MSSFVSNTDIKQTDTDHKLQGVLSSEELNNKHRQEESKGAATTISMVSKGVESMLSMAKVSSGERSLKATIR
jgi:hypothetical protein